MTFVSSGGGLIRHSLLLIKVVPLRVSVASLMMNAHCTLYLAVLQLEDDESVHYVTGTTGAIVHGFGLGRNDLKVIVALKRPPSMPKYVVTAARL